MGKRERERDEMSEISGATHQALDDQRQEDDAPASDHGTRPLPYPNVRSWPRKSLSPHITPAEPEPPRDP